MRMNWRQVRVMTFIYLAFLALYWLIICVPVSVPAQNRAVLAAIAAQAAFSIAVFLRREPPRRIALEYAALMLFGSMIMALSIYLGTYVFRDNTAWLFLIEIIMLTQFYTMPPRLKCAELLAYLIAFLICSFRFKSSGMALLDAAAGTSAMGVGMVSYFSLMSYKLESFENRDELSRMCSLDGMTGLMNKTTFMHFCSAFLRNAPLSRPYALAVMDVDHFKNVNDSHGHMAGDEVLHMIAACLRAHFPEGDFETGRFGGDEFTVLIRRAERDGLEQMLLSVMDEVSRKTQEKAGFAVTLSAGIAFASGREMMFADLFVAADRALYEAKRNGGNTVSVRELSGQDSGIPVIAAVDLDEQELKAAIAACGKQYEVIPVLSGSETKKLLDRRKQQVQIVLMSVHQSSFRRAEALCSVRQIREVRKIPLILIVGEGDETSDLAAIADAVLRSPLVPSQLEAAAERMHASAVSMQK